MRPIASLLVVVAASLPLAHTADAPPATDPGAQPAAAAPPAPTAPPEAAPPAAPPTAPPIEDGQQGGGRDRMMRRLVEQNPELQGVDLNTPEGQEKVRAVMQKRMEAEAPRMRQRMAEGQAAARAEIQKAIAMKDEEFAAITPLLERVETLRFHRTLVDRQGGPMGMMGGRNGRGQGGPGGGFGGMMPDAQVILGDTPLDPAAKEIQDALKALKSVVADPQANEAETELATARVRKAREAWQAAMTKAQEELRAVLTHHQEAILLDRGVIE